MNDETDSRDTIPAPPPALPDPERPKQKRGFATMTPEQVRAIASAGGKAAHTQGKAHHFTPEEARLAGAKGGRSVHRKRGTGHMSTIGRVGGKKSHEALLASQALADCTTGHFDEPSE